jgi:hypothetical protein
MSWTANRTYQDRSRSIPQRTVGVTPLGGRVAGASGMTGTPGRIDALITDGRVVESGVGAAARLGAAVDVRPGFQVYVRESDWGDMEREYRLNREHSEPNVVFPDCCRRSTRWPPTTPTLGRAGRPRLRTRAPCGERAHEGAGMTDDSQASRRVPINLSPMLTAPGVAAWQALDERQPAILLPIGWSEGARRIRGRG